MSVSALCIHRTSNFTRWMLECERYGQLSVFNCSSWLLLSLRGWKNQITWKWQWTWQHTNRQSVRCRCQRKTIALSAYTMIAANNNTPMKYVIFAQKLRSTKIQIIELNSRVIFAMNTPNGSYVIVSMNMQSKWWFDALPAHDILPHFIVLIIHLQSQAHRIKPFPITELSFNVLCNHFCLDIRWKFTWIIRNEREHFRMTNKWIGCYYLKNIFTGKCLKNCKRSQMMAALKGVE